MSPTKKIGRSWLRHQGFQGFATIAELRTSALASVPSLPGVYAVLRESVVTPVFLAENPGSKRRGRDPTVSMDVLREHWNPTCQLMYLGKAGTARGKVTLRHRVRAYLQFGSGRPVSHWGGRLTWQLPDVDDLLVAWRITKGGEARPLEKHLISTVEATTGQLPFANLQR